jgi:hypothetical protein
MTKHLQLATRAGSQPRTTTTFPHSQLDQQPADGRHLEAVIAEAATWPWVRRGDSGISVEGARALLLGPECGSGPAEAFMIGREFCHGHAGGDFSLHATLPVPLAEAVVEAGWAELHFLAETGQAPRTVVLIYAPRDDHERDVVLGLVRASYEFALGQPNPSALPLVASDG